MAGVSEGARHQVTARLQLPGYRSSNYAVNHVDNDDNHDNGEDGCDNVTVTWTDCQG